MPDMRGRGWRRPYRLRPTRVLAGRGECLLADQNMDFRRPKRRHRRLSYEDGPPRDRSDHRMENQLGIKKKKRIGAATSHTRAIFTHFVSRAYKSVRTTSENVVSK